MLGGGGGGGRGREGQVMLAFVAAAASSMGGGADTSVEWRRDMARRGEETTQIQRRDKRLVRRGRG